MTKKALFTYIDTEDALEKLVKALNDEKTVSLDTEADSFHHYYPKVCLIQLSFNNHNFIIDPLCKLDLSPFFEQIQDKCLIFHDAGYDLRMLKRDFKFEPKNEIFDTMLAGKLLGIQSLNLAGMLQEVLGAEICKTNQKANWSKRPLPENLLDYAALDTHYLLELSEKLKQMLIDRNRLDWHKQMCQKTIKSAMIHIEQNDPDADWRIKGISCLLPRQLAFVRQLWLWRDKQARKADLPAFRILHNERLIELALEAESQREPDFSVICQSLRHIQGKRLETLSKAMEKAFLMKPEQWPARKKSKRPPAPEGKYLVRIEKLRQLCKKTAEENNLSSDLIVSRTVIGKLAQMGAGGIDELISQGVMLAWQAELIRQALAGSDVFEY